MDKSKNPEPPKYSRRDYLRAEPLLMELHKHHKRLTCQQSQTIKRQALSGDIDGARSAMERMLESAREGEKHGRTKEPRDYRLESLLQ